VSIEPVLTAFEIVKSGSHVYADCSKSSRLSFGGFAPYTIEALIRPSNVEGPKTIAGRFNGSVEAEYALFLRDGLVSSYRNVEPWALDSKTPVSAGEIHHIATSYDGSSTLSIHIDGKLDCSTDKFTSQPSASSTPMTIGCVFSQGVPTDFFDGEIFEIRVWNICLSHDQLSSYLRPLESAPGLVAQYKLMELPPDMTI
jgi:hypothetical protein